jgi:WXG100 family type VII secretion target
MSEIVRADYERLDQLAGRFSSQSEAVNQMQLAVNQAVDQLKGGGWEGRGSAAFFEEMEGTVSPAVQRLIEALAQAATVTRQISQIFKQADEEASSPFRAGAGTGASGGFGAGSGAGGVGGMGGAAGSAGRAVNDLAASMGARFDAILGGGSFSIDSLGSGSGGVWAGGGFNPTDVGFGGLENILNGSGFMPGGMGNFGAGAISSGLFGSGGLFESGGGFGGGFFGGDPFGGSGMFGGNDYGIPHDWLDGVTDSLSGYTSGNYNDYGIPHDWLDGVTGGGGSYNDFGIPRDWLSDVTDSFSPGDSFGGEGFNAGASMGGGGSAGGGGMGGGMEEMATEETPASTGGGGSGGGSSPSSDIRDPFGRGNQSGGPRVFGSAAAGSGAAAPGGLRMADGGASGSSSGAAAQAAPSRVMSGSGGSTGGAAAPAQQGGGNFGLPVGIAAASPLLAILGKATTGRGSNQRD